MLDRKFSIEKFYERKLRLKTSNSIVQDAKEETFSRQDALEGLGESGSDNFALNELALFIKMTDNSAENLEKILSIFSHHGINKIIHMESRKSEDEVNKSLFEIVVILVTNEMGERIATIQDVLSLPFVVSAEELATESRNILQFWIPRHISDLDHCRHLELKFNPDIQSDHPGFHDEVYRKRRQEIANLAFGYKNGDAIPRIEYNDTEKATWKEAYTVLNSLYDEKASIEHIKGLRLLEEHCGYCPEEIPQLEEISKFLHKTTGFRLRPAAGLISPRDFLASLAFRVFQCTQYIRHHSQPLHTPEPDCIHELLGHMPLLTNKDFASFSQKIGLASLGVSDKELERLATLYWFTVEFGLIREDGKIKAIGAGLLSSFGELNHALSDVPEQRPFDAKTTALVEYQDVTYQPCYFVCESLKEMKQQMKDYAKQVKKPFQMVYDPYTENMLSLNTREGKEFIHNMMIEEIDIMTHTITIQ